MMRGNSWAVVNPFNFYRHCSTASVSFRERRGWEVIAGEETLVGPRNAECHGEMEPHCARGFTDSVLESLVECSKFLGEIAYNHGRMMGMYWTVQKQIGRTAAIC
jgi:hypothetical protein